MVFNSNSNGHLQKMPLRIDPHVSRVKRLKKGTLTAARLIHQYMVSIGQRFRVAMLTLTYRPNVDWQPYHLTNFRKAVAQYLNRRGIKMRYVWVMELTKRGVPHYHVLIWLPRGITLPKPDKRGWWPHGMTRIEWARNAVGYVAKYASKADSTNSFPRGARIHGCGGLEEPQRNVRSWWIAPSWVRKIWPNAQHKPRPAPGGGWFSRVLGDWHPSPWLVDFKEGSVFIRLREALPHDHNFLSR